jgi:hypothetical protein
MCTLVFLKQVMNGSKKLMKMSQVNGIPKIPRIQEISSEAIWYDIKYESIISQYFPDSYIQSSRTPDRTYMFSVSLQDLRSSFT